MLIVADDYAFNKLKHGINKIIKINFFIFDFNSFYNKIFLIGLIISC